MKCYVQNDLKFFSGSCDLCQTIYGYTLLSKINRTAEALQSGTRTFFTAASSVQVNSIQLRLPPTDDKQFDV